MKAFKRPVQRRTYSEEEPDETPRILSSEEKRELILAHSRSQTAKDPLQRMTVWGGVMIAVLGIAGGWWWTVGSNIQMSVQKGSTEYQVMTDDLNKFADTIKNEKGSLQKPISPTNNANADEPTGLMKAVLEGSGQKKRRDDLLAPHTAGIPQVGTTSTAIIDTPIQLIDPADPGLTPDQQ